MTQPSTVRDTLIIFDCDGVLVDSEPISVRITTQMLQESGLSVDAEFVYRNMLGHSIASSSQMLRETMDFTLDDHFRHQLNSALMKAFSAELQPIPFIHEAIGVIGSPICVASSSPPERIRHSLAVAGFQNVFDNAIFSATQVKNGKPAPDLLLFAAEKFDVPPGRCLVIEDSPPGIMAAKAAGMTALAFTGGSHIGPAQLLTSLLSCRPDGMIQDMTELPAWIERWRSDLAPL